MKKQKLLNILFIDSTSIKVSQDANKNKNNQEQSVGCSKGGMITNLHLCRTSSCPVAFHLSPGSFYGANEKES